MDSDAARAELPAVDDEVVRQRAGAEELVAGGGGEQPEIVGVRHRERMVGRDRTPLTVDPLEQREVDDPDELEAALRHGRAAEVEPQLTEHGVHAPPGAGNEQQQVAGLGAERVDDAELLGLREELRHRRVEATVVLHPHPHEPGGAELLGALGQRVEAPAPHRALPRHPDPLHRLGLEGAELGGGTNLVEVDELEPEAQVGLVGPETRVGFVPRDAPDRGRLVPGRRDDRGLHRRTDHGHYVVGVRESHLRVELHELELAIGAQVFVAQAARDLVVAIESAHHEQLLEQLRALRQRVELARREA